MTNGGIIRFLTTTELRVSAQHNLTDARTQHQLYWAAEKIEQSEETVDRLARALARTDPVNVVGSSDWWCDECSVHFSDRNDRRNDFPHADDCLYVWAVGRASTTTRKQDNE